MKKSTCHKNLTNAMHLLAECKEGLERPNASPIFDSKTDDNIIKSIERC